MKYLKRVNKKALWFLSVIILFSLTISVFLIYEYCQEKMKKSEINEQEDSQPSKKNDAEKNIQFRTELEEKEVIENECKEVFCIEEKVDSIGLTESNIGASQSGTEILDLSIEMLTSVSTEQGSLKQEMSSKTEDHNLSTLERSSIDEPLEEGDKNEVVKENQENIDKSLLEEASNITNDSDIYLNNIRNENSEKLMELIIQMMKMPIR